MEIDNRDKNYYLAPQTIKAIVKNMNYLERIVKIDSVILDKEAYLHQWRSSLDEEWLPCCSHDINYGLIPFERCELFQRVPQLIKTYGKQHVIALTVNKYNR